MTVVNPRRSSHRSESPREISGVLSRPASAITWLPQAVEPGQIPERAANWFRLSQPGDASRSRDRLRPRSTAGLLDGKNAGTYRIYHRLNASWISTMLWYAFYALCAYRSQTEISVRFCNGLLGWFLLPVCRFPDRNRLRAPLEAVLITDRS